MKPKHGTAALVILFALSTTQVLAAQTSIPADLDTSAAAVGTAAHATLDIDRTDAAISIDGVLDDAGWQDATYASGFTEMRPREGVPAEVPVHAWLTYDSRHLYVGFRVEDDPSQVRASLRDRDGVMGDDLVGIILDTFGNNSWAYIIGSNPLGVQLDVRTTTGSDDDMSFDVIYESAGRMTDTGYEVEMAIPFSSLRFPKDGEWGVNFLVIHPRATMRQYAWAPLTQDNPCMLCQNAVLTGLEGVQPGSRIEVLPSIVATQSGSLADGDDPTSFTNADPSAEASLGVRYPISAGWTAEATYNPDFSQVESDAAQIDVNTTFALSYPERRPFFQEGSDLFETQIDQVYTRAINSPVGAAKLIGRQGKTSVGYIGAVDERTPILVPLEERSLFVPAGRSMSNIMRVQRTLGEASQIGTLLTDRRYDGGGSGTTLGADARLRLSESWELSAQLVGSYTVEPDNGALGDSELTFDGHSAAFDGESYAGYASTVRLRRSSRIWNFSVAYEDASPTFRTENGFQTRNAFRTASAYGSWSHFPDSGLLDRAQVQLYTENSWNSDGVIREQALNPSMHLELKSQTRIGGGINHRNERFDGTDFDGLTSGWMYVNSSFIEALSFGVSLNGGDAILREFGDARRARSLGGGFGSTIRPTQRLSLTPEISYQRLETPEGEELFAGYVSRARLEYQFTRELFTRLVVQYNDFSEAVSVEPLIMYRVNPFSVVYLGSTHGYNGFEDPYGFTQTDRQIFLKVQYLFRP